MEGESNFQSKFTWKGTTDTQVFNDKYLQTVNENGWGVGGTRCKPFQVEREQTYKDLMCIMGQKLLTSRAGVADVSHFETVCNTVCGDDK